MVDIQIVCESPSGTDSYWKWKVVTIPEDQPDPADLGQYRDVTLAKVCLEYTRLKYNVTAPPKTDIYWSVIPFQDFAKYQVVCIEGNTKYTPSSYPNFQAETPIFFDIYVNNAFLGEEFFELESILTGIQAVWLNYDAMRINGLADMMLSDKLVDQETLSRNRTQFQEATFLKELVFSAFYEVQRTTDVARQTWTFAQPNFAGDYATN